VHGGQNPIVGAQVYLFAANAGVFTPNASGYGNASLSLLTAGTGRTLDQSGGPTNGDYYVTSDSNGNFSISATTPARVDSRCICTRWAGTRV